MPKGAFLNLSCLFQLGAFLVPYILFLLFCGIPFCYMELTLGQYTGMSPVKAFAFAPMFKGELGIIFSVLTDFVP